MISIALMDQRQVHKKQFFKQLVFPSLGFLTSQVPSVDYSLRMSAFLINPGIIMTYTDNVYNRKKKEIRSNFRFHHGINGNTYGIKDIKIFNNYKRANQQQLIHDICILILSSKIQSYSGERFTLCTGFPQKSFPDLIVFENEPNNSKNTMEDPIDINKNKNESEPTTVNEPKVQLPEIIKSSEYKVKLQQHKIQYQIETKQFEFGSPIAINISNHFRIVGLHASKSFGTLLTEDLIFNILRDVEQEDRDQILVFDLSLNRLLTAEEKIIAVTKYFLYRGIIDIEIKKQPQSQRNSKNSRLGGEINFRISSKFYEYIKVNGQRLYFDLYSKTKSTLVKDIDQQYFLSTGNHLQLTHGSRVVQPNKLLNFYIKTDEDKVLFQKLLNIINSANQEVLLTLNNLDIKQEVVFDKQSLQKFSKVVEQEEKNIFKIRSQRQRQRIGPQKLESIEYSLLQLINENKEDTCRKGQLFLNKEEKEISLQTVEQLKKISIGQPIQENQKNIEFIYKDERRRILLLIQETTSLKSIINYIKKKYNIDSNRYSIKRKEQIYSDKDFNIPFICLDILEAKLQIQFYQQQCYLSPNTRIKINKLSNPNQSQTEKGDYDPSVIYSQQLSFSTIAVKLQPFEVIAAVDMGNSFIFSSQLIKNLSSNIHVTLYYVITYKRENLSYQLQCTKDTLLKLQTRDWITVEKVEPGSKIYGVDGKNRNKPILFTIIKKQSIFTETPLVFYSLSVENVHTFIGNNLILHNRDPITIQIVYPIGNEIQSKQFNVHVQQLIGHPQNLYIGGTILRSTLSFGDYQLNEQNRLFNYSKKEEMFEKVSLSLWKQEDRNYNEFSFEERRRIQLNYLGLYSKKLTTISSKKLDILTQGNINRNVIALESIYLIRMLQLKNEFDQKYLKQMKERSKQQTQYVKIEQKNVLSQQFDAAFNMFNNELSLNFEEVNRQKIQKIATIIYRGVPSYFDWIMQAQEIGKILLLQDVTYGSTDILIAQNFTRPSSVMLKIETASGRPASEDSEVLLPPSCCFVVESFSQYNFQQKQGAIRMIFLKEVPQPLTYRPKLIFWVDDQPVNLEFLGQLDDDIEVVEVRSLNIMRAIIRKFLWIYRFLQKKMMIISSMAIREGEGVNQQAGADLLDYLYNDFGYTIATIIRTSNPLVARGIILGRNINSTRWTVDFLIESILEKIEAEFEI